MKYYISKKTKTSFEEAEKKTEEALKAEGFGVLTQIDMQQKLQEKLGIDYPKYKILGACNPSFSEKILKLDSKIGVMLPCNIIIQDIGNNEIEVSAIDPVASMIVVDNQDITEIAKVIKTKLNNVINSL